MLTGQSRARINLRAIKRATSRLRTEDGSSSHRAHSDGGITLVRPQRAAGRPGYRLFSRPVPSARAKTNDCRFCFKIQKSLDPNAIYIRIIYLIRFRAITIDSNGGGGGGGGGGGHRKKRCP